MPQKKAVGVTRLSKSFRLYTTITPELGAAVRKKAAQKRVTAPDLFCLPYLPLK